MMRIVKLAVLALLSSVLMASAANAACEDGYEKLTLEQAKEYRDKLIEQGAVPLDRQFSFAKLVCSDNPQLRDYAVREGLKSTNDPLIRNQILLDALLQKTRLDIKLARPASSASKETKTFVEGAAGLLSYQVRYTSPSEGCISLYSKDQCSPGNSLYVRGNKVEFSYESIVGEFRLTDGNELLGYVVPHSRIGKLDAVIELF